MKLFLFYDTETTGMYDFKRKPDHPSQPHLVQYAGLLVDPESRRIFRALACLVNSMVKIPAEATKVHGITNEMVQRGGAEPEHVLNWHWEALSYSNLVVAHNISFDRRIMDTVATRTGIPEKDWPSKQGVPEYCTMKAGTDLCKLPGPYGFKWPKLEELHQHLFHEGFPAHDALADVQACAKCYFKMVGNKPKKPEPEMKMVHECPLCAAPIKENTAEPGGIKRQYCCGCEMDPYGKVLVPCASGVPKK